MESSFARSRGNLFDEDDSASSSMTQSQTQPSQSSNSLFQDDGSPWDMPTPRKQHTRADLLRNLLPASDVPESYIETFDAVVRDDGSSGGKVSAGGVTRVLAAAKLPADAQAKIMGIVALGGGEATLGRNEFNVLLGLIGLAQEHETVSLDGVDERRRSEFAFLSSLLQYGIPTFHILVFIVWHSRICNRLYFRTVSFETALSLIYARHLYSVDVLLPRHHSVVLAPNNNSSCGAGDRSMAYFLLLHAIDAVCWHKIKFVGHLSFFSCLLLPVN